MPVLVATWAVIGTGAAMLAVFTVLSITSAVRRKPDHLGDIVGRAVGATIVFAIPLALAYPAGLAASALLVGIGAPPLTYLFILFGAVMSFIAATKHSSAGMEGCTKFFGLVWSGYAIVWCITSFQLTGGFRTIEADAISLTWLQPPLAALPFAIMILKVSDRRKRTAWLFTGAMVFLSALLALCFLPIERGFAAALLPRSDWLRFPLAALALALLLFLVRLVLFMRLKPNIRRIRSRDLKTNMRIIGALMVAMGLSWALARTIVQAVV